MELISTICVRVRTHAQPLRLCTQRGRLLASTHLSICGLQRPSAHYPPSRASNRIPPSKESRLLGTARDLAEAIPVTPTWPLWLFLGHPSVVNIRIIPVSIGKILERGFCHTDGTDFFFYVFLLSSLGRPIEGERIHLLVCSPNAHNS